MRTGRAERKRLSGRSIAGSLCLVALAGLGALAWAAVREPEAQSKDNCEEFYVPNCSSHFTASSENGLNSNASTDSSSEDVCKVKYCPSPGEDTSQGHIVQDTHTKRHMILTDDQIAQAKAFSPELSDSADSDAASHDSPSNAKPHLGTARAAMKAESLVAETDKSDFHDTGETCGTQNLPDATISPAGPPKHGDKTDPPPPPNVSPSNGPVSRAIASVSETPVNNTMPSSEISTLSDAASISDQARGIELYEAAKDAQHEVTEKAKQDDQVLKSYYTSMPMDQMGKSLEQAKTKLEGYAKTLESAVSGDLDPSERARFHNLFLNAADKADAGLGVLQDGANANAAINATSPFGSLLTSGSVASDDDKKKAMAALLGLNADPGLATTNEALATRELMYNGLPAADQSAATKALKLEEMAQVTGRNGVTVTIPILHNGYIFGGHGSAMDCSSFVSSVLPADARKGRYTTLDFRAIWYYDRSGVFPKPPVFDQSRQAFIKGAAKAFSAVDIYEGDPLQIGDLLVFRLPGEAAGHVFIVRDYDPKGLSATVIEAAQSAGTVRERKLPLSLDPLNAKIRLLRPGFMALRLKPVSTQVCQYRDAARGDSSRGPASYSGGGESELKKRTGGAL